MRVTDGLTDRQKDSQTDRITTANTALTCVACGMRRVVKINEKKQKPTKFEKDSQIARNGSPVNGKEKLL